MRSRALLIVLIAGGCATGYHPSGFGGGFSELRLSQRAWQVNFRGNGYTSPERSHSFALRRAAELTLASGYQAFYVAGGNESVSQVNLVQPVNCYSTGPYTNCSGGGVDTINRPRTRLDITMVTGQEAAKAPPGYLVYDANMILAQIPAE
jgi:hypothetical protein